MMPRALRSLWLTLFVGLVAAPALDACALRDRPQMPGEATEEHGEAEELAEAAVSYAEMRRTPRGKSSGLEQDLEPMRKASADDKVFFEGAATNIDLIRRAKLRAFEGAPPVIPHSIRQDYVPECLACHGARLVFRERPARPICHDEHTNCTSCHVQRAGGPRVAEAAEVDPRAVPNSFVGLLKQIGGTTAATEPPQIPHRTAFRERCAACHGEDGPGAGHHPVNFALERELPPSFVLSLTGRLTCRTCHEPSPRIPAMEAASAASPPSGTPQGSELCLACHQSAHEPVFERLGLSDGKHPGGKDLDRILSERMGSGVRPSGCLGCHGTNGALQQGVLRDAGEGKACAVCHREQVEPARNHPVNVARTEQIKLPAELPVGDGQAPICGSCHDLTSGTGDHLLRSLGGGRSLCLSCHPDREEAMKGAHGKAGVGQSEPCFGCHQVHSTDKRKHLLATTGRATAGDPLGCLACHGSGGTAQPKTARPGAKGHPVDGQAHAGFKGTLTCVSCHDAHLPDPKQLECTSCHKERLAEVARGGHGEATCLDCHPTHADAALATVAGVNPSAQRCLACHDSKQGKENVPHVADYTHPAMLFTPGGERWEPLGALTLFDRNGKPVAANADGDLSCLSCHYIHGPDATHPAENLRRPGWQGVCSACHGDDALMVYNFFHDREKIGNLKQ